MILARPQGDLYPSASADAKALARRTSWWLPGDLTLSRSSPPGKKNSRGAVRLRQIDADYNLLPQVRRGVTGRIHPQARLPTRSGGAVTRPQTRTDATGSLRARYCNTVVWWPIPWQEPETGKIFSVRPPGSWSRHLVQVPPLVSHLA